MAEYDYPKSPGVKADMILRVTFSIISILLCFVPLRILIRNGVLSSIVLVLVVIALNTLTIINCLIWRSNDWGSWWDGNGFCDFEVYVLMPLQTLYASSIFGVMYHLAVQVQVDTIPIPVARHTRICRNICQSILIFPVPLAQLIFTHYDLAQRYIVGTLVGCVAVYDTSWPKLVLYDIPPSIFAAFSILLAKKVYKKYKAMTREHQDMFGSGSIAISQSEKTRRRLFLMAFSILCPYALVIVGFATVNVVDTSDSLKDYDFHRIHNSATPYPWETILFVPSWIMPPTIYFQPWVPILTTIPIVIVFGNTFESRQMYRDILQLLGITQLFEWLGSLTCCCSRRRNEPPQMYGRGTRSPTFSSPSTEPSIELPDRALLNGPSPTIPPPGQALRNMPRIPDRLSSLRRNISFRMPTLSSLTPSLPSSFRSHIPHDSSDSTVRVHPIIRHRNLRDDTSTSSTQINDLLFDDSDRTLPRRYNPYDPRSRRPSPRAPQVRAPGPNIPDPVLLRYLRRNRPPSPRPLFPLRRDRDREEIRVVIARPPSAESTTLIQSSSESSEDVDASSDAPVRGSPFPPSETHEIQARTRAIRNYRRFHPGNFTETG